MELVGRLDQAVETAIAERRIVGAVLLVQRRGEMIYGKAHGLADREAGRAMTLDTIFRLSSLTKPIVAAAVLALVDAGKLGLDDPISRHLPDFKPRLADGSAPEITIHHLLTHTSGLSSVTILSDRDVASGVNRWMLGYEETLRRLASLPLLFAPGTGWSYGPSLDVLGVLVGQLAGGLPMDAIERYVTGPLGMTDTRFAISDMARLAAAYADGAQGPVLMGDPHSVQNAFGGMTTYDPGRIFNTAAFQSGGGGMAGTGPDFLALIEALRTGGGTVLRPETAALGLSNQTTQLAQAQGPGWGFGYFGAWLDDPMLAGSPAPKGTNRWGGIYGHNWFIDAENDLSVVSMSNTGLEGSDGAFRDEVAAAIYRAL